MDNNEAFSIDQPFVTQEQKFKYWQESKVHIKALEAAQQQSAGEIAELEKIKGQLGQNVIDLHREVAMLTKNNANLKADNERLREALETIANESHSDLWQGTTAKEALSATTQSLQAHDNEVKG